MSDWQPIETAPLDATEVLIVAVFDNGINPLYAVASNDGHGWRDMGDMGWGGTDGIEPTHWMPLPEPPKLTG